MKIRRRYRISYFKVFFVLTVCMAVLLFVGSRFLYPFHYRDLIISESGSNGLEPQLIAAVIRVESRYNPRAISRTGAVGLMQIMPATGIWVAEKMALPPPSPADLADPALNIRLGTWYLAFLLEEFGDDLPLALAAYNAGLGHVKGWIRSGRFIGTEGDISAFAAQVPFPETRRYLERVFFDRNIYRRLYVEFVIDGENRITPSVRESIRKMR